MTTGADVRDILELTGGENDGPITKKDLINSDKVGHKLSKVRSDFCFFVFQNSHVLIYLIRPKTGIIRL